MFCFSTRRNLFGELEMARSWTLCISKGPILCQSLPICGSGGEFPQFTKLWFCFQPKPKATDSTQELVLNCRIPLRTPLMLRCFPSGLMGAQVCLNMMDTPKCLWAPPEIDQREQTKINKTNRRFPQKGDTHPDSPKRRHPAFGLRSWSSPCGSSRATRMARRSASRCACSRGSAGVGARPGGLWAVPAILRRWDTIFL